MNKYRKIFYDNILPLKKLSNKKVKVNLFDESNIISAKRNRIYLESGKNKLFFIFFSIFIFFFVIIFQLYNLSLINIKNISYADQIISEERGNIIDRNNNIIAATISTLDLYINTKKIIDPIKTKKKLIEIFPKKSVEFFDELFADKKYKLINKHLSEKQEYEVKKLGEPGLVFHKSNKRVYPHNNLFSHLTGFMSRFGKPQSKIEKNFDEYLSRGSDLKLTVDLNIQDIIHREIYNSKNKFNSKSALGLLMNVDNGEIISLVSLPDYDPNHPSKIKPFTENNLITNARFEMGSTLKMFNAAMAIENDSIKKEELFNVNEEYQLTKNYIVEDEIQINDPITFETVFIKSSNVGSIKILEKVGIEKQRIFYTNLGLNQNFKIKGLNPIENSLPSELEWNDVRSKSISYGYGISLTPISLVSTFSSLVNGGFRVKPKILLDEETKKEKVIKSSTSEKLNSLLYQVVENGTGRNARIKGINIGGKTGTARKAKNKNGYYNDKIITSFIGTFPIENPRYILFVLFDEPKNILNQQELFGSNTAAPVFANILERISPILGFTPPSPPKKIIYSKKINGNYR